MWDEKCGALTKKHVYTKTPRYHIDYIKKAIYQKASIKTPHHFKKQVQKNNT